jgi:hypothetical protein
MATPVFCCGFECGQIAAAGSNVGQHWTTTSGAPTIDTTTVRSGARSLATDGTDGAGLRNVFSGTRVVFRTYVRFVTLGSANANILDINNTSGLVGRIAYRQATSSLVLARAGLDGGTTFAVTTGQWYRIDITTDGAAGGSMEAAIDGTSLGTLAHAASAGNIDEIKLQAGTGADLRWDDCLGSNTTADYPLGAGYVNHFVPTSDGTHNIAGAADFRRGTTATDITNATTTAYQLIDEVPLDDTTADADDFIALVAPPNATDYVECVFGPAPGISTPTAGPRAVEVIAGIHQAGTGTGNVEIRLNDNGTMGTVYTATTVAGTTTLTYKRAHFADPPSAATAWHALNDGSNGDFLDLRMRFGSPAAVDANPDQYLDCIMVEAEFVEVVGGRTTKNTRSHPLGIRAGMGFRVA